jgi:hypothetical protein
MTDQETDQLSDRRLLELILTRVSAMEPRFRDLDARLTRFERIYAAAMHFYERTRVDGLQLGRGA